MLLGARILPSVGAQPMPVLQPESRHFPQWSRTAILTLANVAEDDILCELASNMDPGNNFEEMYLVFYGASQCNESQHGAKYEVIKRWFLECNIIDKKIVTETYFESTYDRIRANKEDLTMAQFINFVCLLANEVHKDVAEFFRKFHDIKDRIIEEIRNTPPFNSGR